jgi:hypothetical protein
MPRISATTFLLALSLNSLAQTSTSEGATLLFSNVKSMLTAADRNQVYKNLGFRLSKDKKQFVSAEDEGSEYPFSAQVYPADLNKDGKEEVFVVFGNTYTSGMTGSSVVLFIKNTTGSYATNLGFPGTPPDLMPTNNKGYPDLLIGGPGFEFPIWRWNGKEYTYFKKIKEQELLKTKVKSIDEISGIYQMSIPKK